MKTFGKRARRIATAAALAGALCVAGCGGGIYLGFDDGFDDDPPSVTIAGPSSTVSAGARITLVAAAADDFGIEVVEFYRIDSTGPTRLGSVLRAPYELMVTVPTDGRQALEVFARAFDFDGNAADSAVLTLPITP